MKIGTGLLLVVTLVCLAVLAGCGDSANNVIPPGPTGGTVTGEVYGRSGGSFVALGGQTVAIGSRTTTSQPGTGRFAINNVPIGAFTVVVSPQAGYGEVLNPEILKGTVGAIGQTVDIGRVLLGQRPPDPGV
jgi:hypothetical protein